MRKTLTAAGLAAVLTLGAVAPAHAASGPINPGAWLMCKISKSFC